MKLSCFEFEKRPRLFYNYIFENVFSLIKLHLNAKMTLQIVQNVRVTTANKTKERCWKYYLCRSSPYGLAYIRYDFMISVHVESLCEVFHKSNNDIAPTNSAVKLVNRPQSTNSILRRNQIFQSVSFSTFQYLGLYRS